MKIYVTFHKETGHVKAFYTKKEAHREVHEVDLTRRAYLVSIRTIGDSKPPQPFEVFKTITEANEYRVPLDCTYHITEIRGY